MNIGAIAFDFGEVLLSSGEVTRREEWAARLGIDLDAFQRRVWPLMSSLDELAPTVQEVIDRVAAEFQVQPPVAERLVAEFHDAWIIDTTLLEATDDLVDVRRGILSNAGRALRFGIDRIPSIGSRLDLIIVSDEVGFEKPDGRIYNLFSTRIGVPIERCVLIDDKAENVEGARAAGMLAIHHVSNASTISELKGLTPTIA